MTQQPMTLQRETFDVYRLPLTGRHLIEASAGTGKTWSITGLYVRLLVERELLPEQIVVVTFTKAATEELTGRIRERVQLAYDFFCSGRVSKEQEFFEKLQQQWQGRDTQHIIHQLKHALARFDRAAIFTIHSFCQRLLTQFTFEAGGQWNLTAIQNQTVYEQQIVEDFWRTEVMNSQDVGWITWLRDEKHTPSQWLSHVKAHMDKSYARIAAVESDGTQYRQQLQQQFSELCTLWQSERSLIVSTMEAARPALNGDYKKILPSEEAHVFDAYCSNDNPLAYPNDLKERWNTQHLHSKLSAAFKKKGEPLPHHPFFDAIASIRSMIKTVEKANKARYLERQQQLLAKLLDRLNRRMPELKQDAQEMAFSDMVLNVYHALQSSQTDGQSSPSSLINAVRQTFRAALIDEFQDTDPLQLTIFEQLFGPSVGADSDVGLWFVGDPKQAIYGFRGADIQAYFKAAQATRSQQTLKTNYRSTPAMVDSINALFATEQPAFVTDKITVDWVGSVAKPKLVGLDDDGSALHFDVVLPDSADAIETSAFGKTAFDPLCNRLVAERVADVIHRIQNHTIYLEKPDGAIQYLQPSDVAVLVRSHHRAAGIREALAQYQVPAQMTQKDSVFNSAAAALLLRWLQALAEPTNDRRLLTLLGDELIGFSGQWLQQVKGCSSTWQQLLQALDETQHVWFSSGFQAAFRFWFTESQALRDEEGGTWMARLLRLLSGERYLTDIMHLAELCQEQSRRTGGLNALITWLQNAKNEHQPDNDTTSLRLESDINRVHIMTQHSSKGLEFPIVFCPDLWEKSKYKTPNLKKGEVVAAFDEKSQSNWIDFGTDQYTDLQPLAAKADFMEQLRLLYVTLTRSIYHCSIIWAPVGVKKRKLQQTAKSALAWLLYGDTHCSSSDNPLDALTDHIDALSPEAFVAAVERFAHEAPTRQQDNHAHVRVTRRDVDLQAGVPLQPPLTMASDVEPPECSTAPVLKRQSPRWRQSSFSALTRDQSVVLSSEPEASERQDDTAEAVTSDSTPEPLSVPLAATIHTFPRGAQPGECLHHIFEHWDFSSKDSEALSDLVARTLDRFAIDREDRRAQWVKPVSEMVNHTLSVNLGCDTQGHHHQALNTLNADQRLAEMSFLVRSHLSLDQWKTALCDPAASLPKPFRQACAQLASKTVNGFLVGFIDCVFCDETGRFHVLDWKSNYLGPLTQDYHADAMEHAMAHHHYYLQALVYLVALHRYLRHVLPNYSPSQHLGGAHYLFLRGIASQPTDRGASATGESSATGAYFWQPSVELIERLDHALG